MSDTINIKNDRHVYQKYHIGALLGLLYVDAVHHEVLIETCPFYMCSATAMKSFRNECQGDIIIFTEIRAKRLRGGGRYRPTPHHLPGIGLKMYIYTMNSD